MFLKLYTYKQSIQQQHTIYIQINAKIVKHSIVKLKTEGDEEENLKEGYINANFINLINGQERLIVATQCPLNQTLGHFWKMILQENMNMIVMHFEREPKSQQIYNIQTQCEQYQPKNVDEIMICGNVQVNLQIQENFENNIIKRILKVNQEGDERNVIQIQWC